MSYALRRNTILLFAALLVCGPAGCGKKGPLYLPDQLPKSVKAKKVPAGSAPSRSPQTEVTSDSQ